MERKCADCPTWTQIVCRHAFGKYWDVKSRNGEGCDHPLDGVAEAWREAGWTPKDGETVGLVLPTRPTVQNAQLPTANSRVNNLQVKMPRRPKVSAKIANQAEMFFGRLK